MGNKNQKKVVMSSKIQMPSRTTALLRLTCREVYEELIEDAHTLIVKSDNSIYAQIGRAD